MSWIFGNLGGKGNQVPADFDLQNLQNLSSPGAGGSPNDNRSNQNANQQQQFQIASGYAFDSTGLERAAKAARELEKSPLAKQILDLSNQQETTKKEEMKVKVKEYEAAIEHAKIEQKKVDYEERKKLLSEEAKIAQQKAQYDDQLARKRYQDQLAQQKKTNQEILREQEASIAKQEQMKYEAQKRANELSHENDLKRIEAKMKARAKVERENRDINLEQIKLKAAEDRQTKLESIKSLGDMFGNGFQSFISDKEKVKTAVYGITLTAVGIYAAKHSIGIIGRSIESRISKPSLVRETSRLNINDIVNHPFKSVKRLLIRQQGDALKDVILKPRLEEHLRDLSISIRTTKKNKGTFGNVLFYGPPGTGKTLVAKNLTEYSGMDYAILTGADVAPLGADAVTSIHKLFDWANTSRKGLIVFIDEADAFLRKRNSFDMNQDLRTCLNAFLNRTGTPSKNFMLILSSNLPSDFDKAVNDRITEYIEFDNPSLEQRQRLVRLYFDKFILEPASQMKSRLKVDNFDYDKVCSKIAEMTDGFSAREISYLGQKWQASTYVSLEGILTEDLMMKVVEQTLEAHSAKKIWDINSEKEKLMDSPLFKKQLPKQLTEDRPSS